MTGHLFLGGPAHLEEHELPGGVPSSWSFPVFEKVPVSPWKFEELIEPPEILTFTYVPRRYAVPDQTGEIVTVYLPAHLDEPSQWEMMKFHGLGQVAEG